jgi:geranylgeranyl diphosphate synthase type II
MLLTEKKNIEELNAEIILNDYGQHPVELYEPLYYILSLGGKRLRPTLALLGFQLYSTDYPKIYKPAAALELFHNFSLMHDDIMDQAPLRRGMETVHVKYNTNTAILSGDVMLVRAYELLTTVDDAILKRALVGFNKCAAEVCEGQQLDMVFEQRKDVSIDEYIEMIRLKTSVLLGYSLELGAIVGGADKIQSDLLYQIGVNMGLGFQIQDDILDAYGDADKFGKQVGGDILANKKTFLLIKALEKADKKQLNELTKWLTAETFDANVKVAAVLEIYNALGIREEAELLMNSYFEKAFADMNKLKADWGKVNSLRTYTKQLMVREL